jgi:beta-galactosidase
MDAKSQQILLEYVQQGGHLICFPTLPKYDLDGKSCTILSDGLSVTSDKIFTDSDGMICWTNTNQEMHAISYIETFRCKNAETLAVTRNKEICGVKVKYRAGSACILGTGFIYQASSHKQAWQHLSLDMNFKGPITCDNPLIITRTRFSADNSGYFFMLNYHNQTLKGKVSFNNQTIKLQPFSGMIIPFDAI